MARKHFFYMLLVLVPFFLQAQETVSLTGRVLDETGQPLPGCHVHIDSLCSITDSFGRYAFPGLSTGKYQITASYMGFGDFQETFFIAAKPYVLNIRLEPAAEQLEEFVVTDNYILYRKTALTTSLEVVQDDFLKQNRAGSMMKTLERMPGISTIEIGSGQSKPLIRGLGFNRVVVAENGIKHEGQQWGADHGLEIDQFNVAEVEVVKGPVSLLYGSDAIGGVVRLTPFKVPLKDGLSGSVLLRGRSNNGLIGSSLNLMGKKDRKFFSFRLTGHTHGDYRVPANQVTYNTFTFDLPDNALRNTAGREMNAFLSGGIQGKIGKTSLSIGNYFNRSGFFADAHGFEIRNSRIDYNASHRDINLPYHQVNHLKIISNSSFFIGENTLEADISYQKNFRQEFSEPTGDGYRPIPPDSLEREFNKDVWNGNFTYRIGFSEDHTLHAGINLEYQYNRIGGWGFIIPDFNRFTSGVFIYDRFSVSENWFLHAGLRFDYGSLTIFSYTDWYVSPVYDESGNYLGDDYNERTPDVEKSFNNLSYSLGAGYSKGFWLIKMNVGKSFRIPDARELGTNGVNYHLFRQEIGNPDITAEEAWQADVSVEFSSGSTNVAFSPFITWFPSYIYLNPTSDFSDESGLQVFDYVQNEVMRWGGEFQFNQQVWPAIRAGLGAEYVYSEQMSGEKKGYGLAFTPPPSIVLNARWEPNIRANWINQPFLSIDYRIATKQNRIVPPEETTEGYQVINLSAGMVFQLGNQPLEFYVQLLNLFNVKYFNHTSYYRLIEIPEPGRNVEASLIIPLNFIK